MKTKLLPTNLSKRLKSLSKNKDIQRKLLITAMLIVVYRLMSNIPIPGIDPEAFKDAFGNNPFNNIFTIISGGRLDRPSVVAIGIAPYINASIILQLLTTIVPRLEDLSKQGETGRNKINQYTRLLTVPLAAIQSVMIYTILTNPSITGSAGVTNLIEPLKGIHLVAFVLTLTAGSLFLMWIGELITENGIGNGASVIISFGIISSIPSLILADITGLRADWDNFIAGNFNFLLSDNFLLFYGVILMVIAMIVVIVSINEASKRVPIMYARRVRDGGAAENHLPLKLNQAGVIPVIFSQALLTFPQIISSFILSVRDSGRLYDIAVDISQSPFTQINNYEYVITYFVLTIAFAYFYTYVIVKPEELAKNLQKSGAFVPGIRPGNDTIRYLTGVTTRLTLFGGLFLAIIAVLPITISIIEGSNNLNVLSGIGGTSLLIIVGVFMDAYRQTASLKSVVSYEKYA